MNNPRRTHWLMPLTALAFLVTAFVTLRAVGQSTQHPPAPAQAAPSPPKHPAPSTPEESATIRDDPTTAPDPSQSADNDVNFPTDI